MSRSTSCLFTGLCVKCAVRALRCPLVEERERVAIGGGSGCSYGQLPLSSSTAS